MISLRLGRLEIDWGKNHIFRNHSRLFLRENVASAVYYYAENHEEQQPAYVRKLRHIIKRLDLLGYSVPECKRYYEDAVQRVPQYYPSFEITFEAFKHALSSVDTSRVALLDDDPRSFDLGELACAILSDPQFAAGGLLQTIDRDSGAFFENLDPYLVLRLLAENPVNLDQDVVWGFYDVLEGGYIAETELYEGLSDSDRFLIVTEGSSDSSILRASLPLVEPDVVDFFYFADMKDNYPFTGTGNLVNFCKGLSAIKVQNKIVVVLDNDTAGHDALRRLSTVTLPENMRVTVLPELDELKHFRTAGPSGETNEDVNGRAATIECFLDLRWLPRTPVVRWTTFNANQGQYQGELINKDEYTRSFFANSTAAKYDLRKLCCLWAHILKVCVS